MSEGKVYISDEGVHIEGLIGNDYNPDGSINEKGVELIDVAEGFAKLESIENAKFIIKSQGGNVNVGLDIRDFIAGIPNASTLARELCASIATVIHTAVPLQNRMIEDGCKYMIHNPWTQPPAGDAATLSKIANELETIEKDLEQHYAKATGSSKETISVFMKNETFLSIEQCKSLGFASQVVPKQQLRAVAKFQTNKNKDMSANGKSRLMNAIAVLQGTAEVVTKNEGREVKAVMIETDQGTVETPFADLAEGDPLMIDGAAVEGSGTYVITSGDYLTVDGQALKEGDSIMYAEGLISGFEIVGATDDAENLAALQAKIEAMEAENATLKASNETLEAENSAAAETLEKLAKMGSKAKMPTAQARFKETPTEKKSFAEEMAERKATYAKK